MNYNVREAVIADYSQIVDMTIQYCKDEGIAYKEDAVEETVKHQLLDSTVLVLYTDEAVVGVFNFLEVADPWTGELVVYKLNWLVEKAHRGHGKLLLTEAERMAKEMGATQMRLSLPKPPTGYEPYHTEYRKSI